MIRFRTIRLLLFVLPMLPSAAAAALDPGKTIAQYGLDVWTSRDGLPQNSVTALLQTRDGYLWLGNEEGAVRFDGVRFTVYSSRSTDAFRRNTVQAFAEGGDGSLWIGTATGLIRKQGDRFTAYRSREHLPDDSVQALLADPDGTIWIGTERGGLARWRNGRFLPVLNRTSGLPDDKVNALERSADGAIWVGTERGLALARGSEVVAFQPGNGRSLGRVNGVFAARGGAIWVSTSKAGLVRIQGGQIAAAYTTADGLPDGAVQSAREDSNGNLWIATEGGLCRLRGGVVDRARPTQGLAAESVISLLEDREGSLWIGTGVAGLGRLRDVPIVSYGRRDGLSNDVVRPVLEDSQGAFWLGTAGGGLNRFQNGRFSVLTTRDGLPADSITALLQARDGALWIGTTGGLVRRGGGRLQAYGRRDGLSSDLIRVLLEDGHGALWVGTQEGLDRLENGRVTSFSERNGLAGSNIKALSEDPEGSLWIGTDTGLSRWRNGALQTFRERGQASYDEVLSLHPDADGTVWIGTSGGGLLRFRNGRFQAITEREGLFDDTAFAILDDGRGSLWISCNRGIFRVARQELEAFFAGSLSRVTSVAYAEGDGMNIAECNGSFQPAGWRARDGRLWFGTIRGVAVVDPSAIRSDSATPPVVIERVMVDGRQSDVASSGKALAAGTRTLEIQYTGLSFLGSERVRFRSRLDGFDRNWVEAGTRRTAYYTNLGPGRYVFHVVACNRDGVWNTAEASLAFSIQPRFTQRPLFPAGIAAAALAIGLAAYGVRVRALKARQRQLEAGIQEAMSSVRVLRGLFPICASCKKIRDDGGYWSQIESYIRDHSEAEFSHSICPECIKQLYPDYAEAVLDASAPVRRP